MALNSFQKYILNPVSEGFTETLDTIYHITDGVDDNISTEYALTWNVYVRLGMAYRGCVGLEWKTRSFTRNLILNPSAARSWMAWWWKGFRSGRFDVALCTTSEMLVPRAVVEAKIRVCSLRDIEADLTRFSHLLHRLPAAKTSDLIGISVFPIRGTGYDVTEITDPMKRIIDRITCDLKVFAGRYPDLAFEFHELDGGSIYAPELELLDEAPEPVGMTLGMATMAAAVTVTRK